MTSPNSPHTVESGHTLVEHLRSPVSVSMFARKQDMLHTLFQERRESADLIEDLLEVLKTAQATMQGMVEAALWTGLEGASEWDRIAGANDLHGTMDAVEAALRRTTGEN